MRLRDASKGLDELSWEEVLRRLIVLWDVDDEGELEAPLAHDDALGGCPVQLIDGRFLVALAETDGGRLCRRCCQHRG